MWKVVLSLLLLAVTSCCVAVEHRTDGDGPPGPAESRWLEAEGRRETVLETIAAVQRLHNDYEAVTVLARDNDLRGRGFFRLAEIETKRGDHAAACRHLEDALGAGPSPETQRRVLLALGHVLWRGLKHPGRAQRAYTQLVLQHPGTQEAEVAQLWLGVLRGER